MGAKVSTISVVRKSLPWYSVPYALGFPSLQPLSFDVNCTHDAHRGLLELGASVSHC